MSDKPDNDAVGADVPRWNPVPFPGLDYVSYREIAFETGRKTSTIKYHALAANRLIPAPDIPGRPGLAPVWRADREDLLEYVRVMRRRPSHGYRSDLHGPLTSSEVDRAERDV